MIAVLVLPGPAPAMHGLDRETPLALLPLGDRPIVQHIVEFLAMQGIRRFEFVLEHTPEKVGALMGDGTRWGCQFRYHLVARPGQPYRSLAVIQEISAGSPWLLTHVHSFPLVELKEHESPDRPVWFCREQHALALPGTILFPGGDWASAMELLLSSDLETFLQHRASNTLIQDVPPANWLCAYSPEELLATQNRLLRGELPGLMMGGSENDPGVRIARNVVLHPSVKMMGPVFIGPNSRIGRDAEIGPNVVISGNSVIDTHTVLRNCLVVSGSYVGEKLELEQVVVERNLLVNARLDAAVEVPDHFLLGRLTTHSQSRRMAQFIHSAAGLILFVLCLPFCLWVGAIVMARKGKFARLKAVRLPAPENGSGWETVALLYVQRQGEEWLLPAGWSSFLYRFLPGLPAVIRGKLRLSGLPPRSKGQIDALSQDWRTLYLAADAGLISQTSVTGVPAADQLHLYLTEAYYRATRSWSSDCKLLFRYFGRLVVRLPVTVAGDEKTSVSQHAYAKSHSSGR